MAGTFHRLLPSLLALALAVTPLRGALARITLPTGSTQHHCMQMALAGKPGRPPCHTGQPYRQSGLQRKLLRRCVHLRPYRNSHPRFLLDIDVAGHRGTACPVVPGFYPALPVFFVPTSRLRHELISQLPAAAVAEGRFLRDPTVLVWRSPLWQIQTILRLSRRHSPQGDGDDRIYPCVTDAPAVVVVFTLFTLEAAQAHAGAVLTLTEAEQIAIDVDPVIAADRARGAGDFRPGRGTLHRTVRHRGHRKRRPGGDPRRSR